jgi:hypothetical protein
MTISLFTHYRSLPTHVPCHYEPLMAYHAAMNLALTLVYFLFATISTSSSQTLIFPFPTPRKPHRHLYFPETPPFFIELHINLPSNNMTDIDMPDADSANLAEPSENMTNAELRPKASPVGTYYIPQRSNQQRHRLVRGSPRRRYHASCLDPSHLSSPYESPRQ